MKIKELSSTISFSYTHIKTIKTAKGKKAFDKLGKSLGLQVIYTPNYSLTNALAEGILTVGDYVSVLKSTVCWNKGIPVQITNTDPHAPANNYNGTCSCSDVNEDFILYRNLSVKKAVEKAYTLDTVILPEDAKKSILTLISQVKYQDKLFNEWQLGTVIEYGKGLTMLFHGEPGTGKTYTAHQIAKMLGKKLLVIGAAEIQTSEPGGANRNIVDAFKDATQNDKILLLDECDSLITERHDVGMVLGSEINTLLTEIEKFDGLCILATNRIETLDKALERRLALILDFPKPSMDLRLAIWKKMLPNKLPLSDVRLEELAMHELTGGQIKNVLLNACRRALSDDCNAVAHGHFLLAIHQLQQAANKIGTSSRVQRALGLSSFAKATRKQDTVTDITKIKAPSLDVGT